MSGRIVDVKGRLERSDTLVRNCRSVALALIEAQMAELVNWDGITGSSGRNGAALMILLGGALAWSKTI
jgi:hypothetical protein